MRERIVVAVLTGLSATLLAVPAASAGVVKYDTEVTITRDRDSPLPRLGEVRGQEVRAWATGGPVQAAARGGPQGRR